MFRRKHVHTLPKMVLETKRSPLRNIRIVMRIDLQKTNLWSILHLAFLWEALRAKLMQKERVKKSLMVNFSPVPPGRRLFSHGRPLGRGAQRSRPCTRAVILNLRVYVCVYVCVSEETAVQLIFPLCGLRLIYN